MRDLFVVYRGSARGEVAERGNFPFFIGGPGAFLPILLMRSGQSLLLTTPTEVKLFFISSPDL